MKFCVLAKISKRSVSFWYQSDSNAYAPLMIKESNEIPLFFYVPGNDFVFGKIARDRFYRNDPAAFGDYFEIIKDPSKHFSIYGNKKPVKQLLYYGIEQYLSHFLNQVLYKTDSIESYRQQFPLRFLFDTEIEDHEKTLIENLFKEAGYFNIGRISHIRLLFRVLADKQVLTKEKAILLLSGIDDVLYLELYKNINTDLIGSSRLEGQGADPRVKILADMIVEYIILQHSYLSIDKDKEIAFLLPFCANLLQNISPIIRGDVELSDGIQYWFRVNERNLNDRLQYYSNETLIYTAIDDLLKSAGLTPENVVILLGTEEISTAYFSNKLLKKYHYVKQVRAADLKDTMQSIFSEIAKSNYTVKSESPVVPPVVARPPLPGARIATPTTVPQMPPKKVVNTPKPEIKIPRLPDFKPAAPAPVKTIKRPPLPPK